MFQVTTKSVVHLFGRLKKRAVRAVEKGRYTAACKYMEASAFIAYTFYLKYHDRELEESLKRLSNVAIRKRACLTPHPDVCVFLDSLSVFRGGLTVQYIRAIRRAGWKLVYISEFDMDSEPRAEMRDEILKSPDATIISLSEQLKGAERIQFIYDAILDASPSRVYLHVSPHDPYMTAACHALPKGMTRFLIDYTDHSFLLGTDCADYSFEFRQRGSYVSSRFRGMAESSLFLLPFYPICDEVAFAGFPPICEGKTVILSGGNFWKVLDDSEVYFKLVAALLEQIPECVILFPGAGNKARMDEMVEKYRLGDRFVLLGWRQDINALFEHCDIFLNTAPRGGGLMSLYAAIHGKPALSLKSNGFLDAESCVCQMEHHPISSETIDELVDKAKRLVYDAAYREEEGKALSACTITKERFEALFLQYSIQQEQMLQPAFMEQDIAIENEKGWELIGGWTSSGYFQDHVVSKLGKRALLVAPRFVPGFIFRRLLRKP